MASSLRAMASNLLAIQTHNLTRSRSSSLFKDQTFPASAKSLGDHDEDQSFLCWVLWTTQKKRLGKVWQSDPLVWLVGWLVGW